MLLKWQFNLLTALGAAALLLVAANAFLFTQNRASQASLGTRQQFISQTVPLEGLYRDIVKALAEVAVRANDRQLLEMLAAQGLSITVNSPAPAAAEAPARKGDK